MGRAPRLRRGRVVLRHRARPRRWRDGVQHLTYEAYEEQAVPKLADIAREVRARWPHTGRIALLHRTGRIEIGESSVIVVVSTPHRPDAFEAGRYAIDALKASVPIWKHEVWDGGADWGTGAQVPVAPELVPSAVTEPTTGGAA